VEQTDATVSEVVHLAVRDAIVARAAGHGLREGLETPRIGKRLRGG
jgi:hypothetical protein